MRKSSPRLKTRRPLGSILLKSRIVACTLALPLAFSLTSFAMPVVRLAYVLFGFSLIIFLHELGHFVVARCCGVKCLAFSLGIGPRMFGWRKNAGTTFGTDPFDPEIIAKREAKKAGKTLHNLESDLPTSAVDPADGKDVIQTPAGPVVIQADTPNLTNDILGKKNPAGPELGHTDYRVSWLPLGGYVRMLGQDDMDPTKVSTDPHAFNQRPIWQRMCIVSAGVIMNLIFAAVAFSIIFSPGIGVKFPPAEVGMVEYNSPAYKAGMKMGDEIVAIDNVKPRGRLEFTDVMIASALSSGHDKIDFEWIPRGQKTPVHREILPLPPRDGSKGFISIGVQPMQSLNIVSQEDLLKESVESRGKPLAEGGLDDPEGQKELAKLHSRDRITRIDGVAVSDYPQMYDLVQAANGNKIKITVEAQNGGDERTITLKPLFEKRPGVDEMPLLFGMGPLLKVGAKPDAGTPADKAGVHSGDVIEKIGDRESPDFQQFKDIVSKNPDKSLELRVLRDGTEKILSVTPKGEPGHALVGLPLQPAKEDLTVVVRDVKTAPEDVNRLKIAAIDGKPIHDWDEVYAAVKAKKAGDKMVFAFAPAAAPAAASTQAASAPAAALTRTLTVTPPLVDALREQTEYIAFVPVDNKTFVQVAGDHWDAVMMGLDHTEKFVDQVYLTLAGLVRRTVSPENLHGIVGIAKVGYEVQERGGAWFWYLMAIVSVNLAVANFLPLPIVDGGLFLLLILEKIRGKPLSLKIQSAIQVVGIVILAGLFIFVTYNDLSLFGK